MKSGWSEYWRIGRNLEIRLYCTRSSPAFTLEIQIFLTYYWIGNADVIEQYCQNRCVKITHFAFLYLNLMARIHVQCSKWTDQQLLLPNFVLHPHSVWIIDLNSPRRSKKKMIFFPHGWLITRNSSSTCTSTYINRVS